MVDVLNTKDEEWTSVLSEINESEVKTQFSGFILTAAQSQVNALRDERNRVQGEMERHKQEILKLVEGSDNKYGRESADVPFVLVTGNSLKNAVTGAITSAQHKDDHLAFDISQNFHFINGRPQLNLTGIYNALHEPVHGIVASLVGVQDKNKSDPKANMNIFRAEQLNRNQNLLPKDSMAGAQKTRISQLLGFLKAAYESNQALGILSVDAEDNPIHNLELKEMDDNEVLTRFISDMLILVHIQG